VQKLATHNYVFRHHLETTLKNDAAMIIIQDIKKMNGLKIVIDHFGRITKIN
jgi:hypothetical protein